MKRIIAIALTFFAIGISCIVCAQDTTTLEDVRVTGISLRAKKTASTLQVAKRNTMASETPAYLSRLGSVTWQSDNGTPFGYSYLRIRGMDQQRINFTVNGVPLNDGEDMGVYTSNITDLLSSMKEVRLTRGSGGSLSGTPIFAGSVEMDISTPDSNRREIELGGGSFGSYKASLAISQNNLKFRASLTGSDGWRDHSWGKSSSYALTYRKYVGNWLLVFNSLAGETRNAQSWLPVTDGNPKRSNALDPEEKDHFVQTINQIQAITKVGKLDFIVSPYWIRLRGNYSYSLDSVTLGNLRLNWDNVGGYFAFKSPMGARTFETLKYSIGATFNSHKRVHTGSIEPYLTRPTYQNYGKKYDASAFLKFDLKFPIRFEGDLQVRKSNLEYRSSDYSFSVFDYTFFNWRGILSYPIRKWQTYLMVSGSQREPTRTDIFGANDHYDASNIAQLNTVKPEKVIDIEAGTVYKNFRLNAFWMEYRNEIVTLGDINYLSIQVRRNVPRSRRYGIEGEGSVDTKVVNFTGNFCWMRAIYVKDRPAYRHPLLRTPFSPELTFNFSVSKIYKGWKTEAWLRHVSSQTMDYSRSSVSKIGGIYTLSANVEKEFKGFTFRLAGNNLLDKPFASAGNLNYDATGNPVSRNLFWQSGVSFFTSITIKL